MNTKKDIFWRIGLAYLFMIMLGAAIAWKVFYIQSVEGQRYRSMADSITTRYMPVLADRGNIYSYDGRLLATSLPNFEVRMDMKADGLTHEIFQQGIDSLSGCMAGLFRDKSTTDYKKQLTAARKRGDRYFLVKKNITYPQLLQLKAFPIFRYGQPVFHSVGYTTPWDGKINGKDAPVGTYYYVIDPKNGRSKLAGYVDIIR